MPILAMLIQTANAQEIMCGIKILGAKTETEADDRSALSLAANINSVIFGESQRESTIEGTKSQKKETSKSNTIAKPLCRSCIKFEKGKNEEGYFSKACMSVQDAAAPYLNSLGKLASELKHSKINPQSCKAMDETYSNIKEIEIILEPLGQTDTTLKKEYESEYAKIKDECGKVGKNIYIESNNSYLAGKISSIFANESGCSITEESAKASWRLSLADVKECNQGKDARGYSYCYICAKLDLFENKTEKSIYKDSFTSPKASFMDMETACKNAQDKAAQEIWNIIKMKFNKECFNK